MDGERSPEDSLQEARDGGHCYLGRFCSFRQEFARGRSCCGPTQLQSRAVPARSRVVVPLKTTLMQPTVAFVFLGRDSCQSSWYSGSRGRWPSAGWWQFSLLPRPIRALAFAICVRQTVERPAAWMATGLHLLHQDKKPHPAVYFCQDLQLKQRQKSCMGAARLWFSCTRQERPGFTAYLVYKCYPHSLLLSAFREAPCYALACGGWKKLHQESASSKSWTQGGERRALAMWRSFDSLG